MPAAFISSEPTIATFSNDVIWDGQRYTYQAQPSGVIFSFTLFNTPKYKINAADVTLTAEGWNDRWNANASQPGVVSISVAQQVTPAGNLADVCFVIVQSSSGRSTQQLEGPIANFFPSVFNPWVAEAVAEMDAIEAANPAGLMLI